MIKNRLILTAILIIAAAVCIAAQTKIRIFRGDLNGIPIQMTLSRSGDKLSGSYFYTRIGKDLQLTGTIDAEGNFKLKETDPAGKITGEFSGKWTEEVSSNGAELQGEWRKPNSADGLGFYASEQMIEFTGGAKLTSKSFAEKNKLKRFEINIEYPELSGVNPAIAAKFNQLSKARAMKGVANFRKEMMQLTKEDLKYLPEGMNNYLETGYGIEWATNDVISIQFTDSFFTGGAHPNSASSTLNFDLKTGKEIMLADLFVPNSNYLKVISDHTIAELKTKLTEMSDDEWISNGAGANAENYASWNLTKKGLMVNFDPYQVAAYAAGPQFVIIPYNKLSGILQREFR
jgi:hypothetical protein